MRSKSSESVAAPDGLGVRPSLGKRWAWRSTLVLLLAASLVIGCGLTVDLLRGPAAVAWADPASPALVDSDEDGIPDVAENQYTGTSGGDFDTDGDGYGDGFEQATGSDPASFYSRPREFNGVRILVAPDGEDVYLVFVVASNSRFQLNTRRKALFVAYGNSGAPVVTALFLTDTAESNALPMFTSVTGKVRSWVLKAQRSTIRLWSVGLGMRESFYTYCDGLLVNRRKNDCIYQLRFATEFHSTSHAEPTENEAGRSPNPGEGMKECEQITFSRPSSPVRHVLSERCETRDHYICPSDCGALQGQTIIDLKKVWLY